MAHKFRKGDRVDLKACFEQAKSQVLGTVQGYKDGMVIVTWDSPYLTTVEHFSKSLMLIETADKIFKDCLK